MKYSQVRPTLKTGDIVLFSGKGWISNIIRLATGSRWSHVGMVVKIPEFDFVCLWESTTLTNIEDVNGHKVTGGVQLVALSKRLELYDGDIGVKKLDRPVVEANKKIHPLRKVLAKVAYEKSEAELLKSVFDLPGGDNKQDLSSVFCSELVAEAYKRLGLLDIENPSNEYTPADFSKMKYLMNGHQLEDVQEITF